MRRKLKENGASRGDAAKPAGTLAPDASHERPFN
jgi:hypothetical protein